MSPELLEVTHGRLNPDIDPFLHVWGWEIPVYLFLGGIVAGLMVLLPYRELKRAARAPAEPGSSPQPLALQLMPFVALALISLGMLALFLDLANKGHVFRFYLAFEPASPMSWGAWILVLVYPILALLGVGGLDEARRAKLREWPFLRRLRRLVDWVFAVADRHRRGLLMSSVAVGIGLGTYTGLLLGTSAARLPWNSAVLGPLFLASGVSTGAAFLLLFKVGDDTSHFLVRADIVAIVVELFLLAMLILGFATGGAAQRAGGELFLGGAYTPVFWAIVVIGGLLVPLSMNLLEVRRRLAPTLLTPALVLVGGIALRAVMVAAGQSISIADIP